MKGRPAYTGGKLDDITVVVAVVGEQALVASHGERLRQGRPEYKGCKPDDIAVAVAVAGAAQQALVTSREGCE
eukprot:1172837-Prorocentrum_minimum.AAC.1